MNVWSDRIWDGLRNHHQWDSQWLRVKGLFKRCQRMMMMGLSPLKLLRSGWRQQWKPQMSSQRPNSFAVNFVLYVNTQDGVFSLTECLIPRSESWIVTDYETPPIRNIATGETSPAITPFHTYHFSILTSLTSIISKLPSLDKFPHYLTCITR